MATRRAKKEPTQERKEQTRALLALTRKLFAGCKRRANQLETTTMIKVALFAMVALIAFAGVSQAKQEKQVTRTIYELSDFPDLEKKAKEVCGGKLVLSDKLKTACQSGTFPSVTKSGAFRNSGIGAELNSLIRQQ
jgi:hypothetical protein